MPSERTIQFDAPSEIRHDLRQLIAEADAPISDEKFPGKFRKRTLVGLTITVGGIGMAIILGLPGASALGLMAGLIALLPTMLAVVNDIQVPDPRKRQTSDQAVTCYFRSIRMGRWSAAHACLSKAARDKELVAEPSLGKDRNAPQKLKLRTPDDLQEYWKAVMERVSRRTTLIGKMKLAPLDTTTNIHRYRVTMNIVGYTRWVWLAFPFGGPLLVYILYLLSRKRHQETFQVLVCKHQSRWSLYSGEISSPVDGNRIVMSLPEARIVRQAS